MRLLPSSARPSIVSTTNFLILSFLVLFTPTIFAPSAAAQGSKRISLYDPIAENDKDNPKKRDEWMMRGRTAPKGQNASALHYRAYQQKMKMRAQRAAMATQSVNGVAPTPWVPLGPAPLTSDQNFFGEVTGRSTAIAIDPSDATGNTVYIAGASGGVWKSTNAANGVATNVTWTPVTDQQASLVNGAISVKSDGSVVLVGTGEPNNAIDSYYGMGILRSADHGATWTLATASDSGTHPFAGIGFTKFAWLPSSNTVVAAAADAFKGDQEALLNPNTANLGMYLSTDGGVTWKWEQTTDHILADTSATDVTYNAKAGKFFASIQYHGIYSSTNGTNWARLSTQPSSVLTLANCPTATNGNTCPLFRGQITTVPGRNEMYFWFVDGGDNDQGIYQSLDGGSTWKQIDETGLTNCGDSGGCGTQQAFYNLEISAVADGTGTDIYAGAVNLFKCKLASGATKCSALDPALGQSWLNLTHVYGSCTIANVHPDEHGLDFMVVSGKDIMYFGNDGGVYRALDGYADLIYGSCSSAGVNSFDNLNTNMGSMTQFVSFSIDPTNQNVVMGGTQDNGSPASQSATASSQFITVLGGDGGYNAINPNNTNEWFMSNTDSFIWGCEAGIGCNDNNVFPIAQPGANIDQGAFYTPFILDPQSTGQMLIGTCRVWRGATANQIFSSLSPNFDTDSGLSCNGSEINQVHGLAAGGPKDANGFSNVVYAVTFGLGPLFIPGGYTTGGEVWVTTNAATTQMTNVTPPANANNYYTMSAVAMDNSDATGKTAYVGVMGFGTSHVWKTTNAGGSWTDWSGNLPDSPVDDLLVDSAAGQIYVGTDAGVFVSSTSSASWVEVGTPSTPGGASGYLPNVPVTAIRMFNNSGVKKLRVSTYGRGIWEYALQTQSFTLSANPTSVSIAQGSTGTSTITVTPLNGFAGTVAFTASGLPTGVTAAFVPPSSTTSSVMTLTVTGAATPGTSTVTVTGTSGGLTAQTTVSLTVTAGPSFTLTASPTSVSVAQGSNGTSTITVVPANGFTGTVAFAASGLPTGVTAAFNPTSSTTSSLLTLTVSASAAPGTSTITVTGTSGALTAQTTVSLTVTGFTLSANPASLTITPTLPGGTSTITVTDVGGFNGNVTLSATGLPTGVTAAFNPNPTGTTSVVTLTAAAGATQGGPTTVTIHGVSGSATGTTTIALTVTPPPNFTLSSNPTSVSIVPGGAGGTSTITVAPQNGFTGNVTMAATGLPTGVTAAFSPNPTTTTSTLTLTASATAPGGGPATVTITGTSGALTATTTVSLTVAQNFTYPLTLTNPASANPGQTTSTTMQIAPASGGTFASNVTYTCSSGLPAGATCSFSPAQINSGLGSTTVTITVQTAGPFTGAAGANRRGRLTSQNQRLWLPLSLPLAGIMLVGLVGKRVPRLYQILGMCLIVAFAGFLVACGSSSPAPPVVTVSPASVNTLYPSLAGAPAQTQQFTASVSNTTSQAVTWAVTGGSANGTIDPNTGLYSAPATLPNPNNAISVTATSSATSTPGSATVNLKTPTAPGAYPVVVTVTEGSVTHTTTFTLTVL